MAGNSKFHNKFHSANHHTSASSYIKDSGLDPIASHQFPFMGDFVLTGLLSSNNTLLGNNVVKNQGTRDTIPYGLPVPGGWNVFRDSVYIDGDTTITGNLTAGGMLTYLDTQVHVTSATEIDIASNNSNSKTVALLVNQEGTNDIVHFKDSSRSAFLITGQDGVNPGWIGINLDGVSQTKPTQRVTIVGSISTVPDPGELGDQLTGQADPGKSGSHYIEGQLHVNDKSFLDQVYIDTTDGNFAVTGSNEMDVDVPADFDEHVNLDKVTVDTTDGQFLVSGVNTNTFNVDVDTQLDQVTVDTADGPFNVLTSGTNNIFQVDVPAHLDRVDIDTTDGNFVVSGTNVMDVDVHAADFDGHTYLDKTTIDTDDGIFTVSGTNVMDVDVPTADFDGHTYLDKTTIDTDDGIFTVSGSNVMDVDVPAADFDGHTYLDKVTIDTTDGIFAVSGSNIMDVDNHAHFDQVTIDTTDGNFVVSGTGSMDIDVPMDIDDHINLDRVTVDTTDGKFHVSGTNIFEVDVASHLDRVDIDTTDGNFVVSGSGSIDIDTNVDIDGHATLDQVTIDTSDGDLTVNGTGSIDIDTNVDIDGHTTLDQVTIDTTDGDLSITGGGWATLTTPLSVHNDVYIAGDLRVDGETYLSAGGSGIIHVGDSRDDNIVFNADVDSDILPNNDNEYSLGSSLYKWLAVHSVSGFFDNISIENLEMDAGETVLGSTTIQTGNGALTIGGSNNTNISTTISATGGPWSFGDHTGGDYIPFVVHSNSIFNTGLTAKGPVQIGNLPDGITDEMPEPTFEVLGNMWVKDGNLKIASDIRHLDDENTLIRFTPDTIALRVGDVGMLTLTEGATDVVEVGAADEPVDVKFWATSASNGDQVGLYYEGVSGNLGFQGQNTAHPILGTSVDIHGSMRVNNTLSAANVTVNNLTVLGQSFGNVGGGSGHANFTTVSGTATVAGVSAESGISFDAQSLSLNGHGDNQKLYSVTFEATSANSGLGIEVGDTQNSTFQVVSKWDDFATQAWTADTEYGIIHTSDSPIASITSIVSTALVPPTTERLVNLIVQPNIDCKFWVHNKIIPKDPVVTLPGLVSSDFEVVGDIVVSGTVDGRDVSDDGEKLDSTYTTWNSVSSTIADNVTAIAENLADLSTVATTSANWDSTYTTVGEASASWADNAADISAVAATSANWDSVYTSSSETSASWDSVYTTTKANSAWWDDNASDITNVAETSANWDSVYTTTKTNSAWWDDNASDVTNVAATSANWDSVYTTTKINSGWWDDNAADITNVAVTSASWDSVYTTTKTNSAWWDDNASDITNVAETSANWDSAYTSVNETSGDWDSAYTSWNELSGGLSTNAANISANAADITNVAVTSANWDSVYTTTKTNSAWWDDNAADLTNVAITSANWDSVYTSVTDTSANWDSTYTTVGDASASWADNAADISAIATTSADWNSTYTTVGDASASWADNAADISAIATTSADWNSVYSFVNTDSGTNNTGYNHTTFVNASGDSMTGTLTLTGRNNDEPGLQIVGTSTGVLTADGFWSWETNYILPDVAITGDTVMHGVLSASSIMARSLTAQDFITTNVYSNGLTVSAGDLLVLDGSIRQRGGNLLIEQDITHLNDENTYIRFQPDQINIACHDVNMMQFSEHPAADDIIKIGDIGYTVDVQVQNSVDANTLFIDGATGYVGIGTGTPTTKFHVDGNAHFEGPEFRVPVGTTAERPSSPANGMIRYDTDVEVFEGHMNGNWKRFALSNMYDADRDTGIDCEVTSDSDTITFYTMGCSAMQVQPDSSVTFGGDIAFDSATVYTSNSLTGPISASSDFLFLYVNGVRRAIRLWDIPANMPEDINTIHGELVTNIGDECGQLQGAVQSISSLA